VAQQRLPKPAPDPDGDVIVEDGASSEAPDGPAVTETPWAGADTDQLARLRTALAAERTVFAVVRSGLAIAGGGAVIVTLLGDRWPVWLQIVLAAGFVIPGYMLMLDGLSRYRRIAAMVKAVDPDHHRMVSPWLMTVLIGVVQVVTTVVAVLLIAGAFEG
jgi:uncharacterized membrane protein YidH (DUF202 family)